MVRDLAFMVFIISGSLCGFFSCPHEILEVLLGKWTFISCDICSANTFLFIHMSRVQNSKSARTCTATWLVRKEAVMFSSDSYSFVVSVEGSLWKLIPGPTFCQTVAAAEWHTCWWGRPQSCSSPASSQHKSPLLDPRYVSFLWIAVHVDCHTAHELFVLAARCYSRSNPEHLQVFEGANIHAM